MSRETHISNRKDVTAGDVWFDIREETLQEMLFALSSENAEIRNEGFNIRNLTEELSSLTEGMDSKTVLPGATASHAYRTFMLLRKALFRVKMLRLSEKTRKIALSDRKKYILRLALVTFAIAAVCFAQGHWTDGLGIMVLSLFAFAMKQYMDVRRRMRDYASTLKDNHRWVESRR